MEAQVSCVDYATDGGMNEKAICCRHGMVDMDGFNLDVSNTYFVPCSEGLKTAAIEVEFEMSRSCFVKCFQDGGCRLAAVDGYVLL